MAPELIGGFIVLAGAFAATACYRAWTAQVAHLNLSLFQPYRRDPWPIGVQEDDDFRFNWSTNGVAAAEVEVEASGVAELTQLISLEEVPSGLVVERVASVAVHRRAN
jgi:hypothetical protein